MGSSWDNGKMKWKLLFRVLGLGFRVQVIFGVILG